MFTLAAWEDAMLAAAAVGQSRQTDRPSQRAGAAVADPDWPRTGCWPLHEIERG